MHKQKYKRRNRSTHPGNQTVDDNCEQKQQHYDESDIKTLPEMVNWTFHYAFEMPLYGDSCNMMESTISVKRFVHRNAMLTHTY